MSVIERAAGATLPNPYVGVDSIVDWNRGYKMAGNSQRSVSERLP